MRPRWFEEGNFGPRVSGSLEAKRQELDPELAEADPYEFTPAMRQGVACAMNADPTRTDWGLECSEGWSRGMKWRNGCYKPQQLHTEVKGVMDSLRADDGPSLPPLPEN